VARRWRSSRGTANLFASNLGIPQDIAAAVEIGSAAERGRSTSEAERGALCRDGRGGARRPMIKDAEQA
jgi:hypothetical protein